MYRVIRFFKGAITIDHAESMPLSKLINASSYASRISKEEEAAVNKTR